MTKQALKVFGTILFLFGAFGYLFPEWGSVRFTNNENLFHALSALLAIAMSNASSRWRMMTLVLLTLFYLAWGIWGFTLTSPLDAKLILKSVNLSTQLDSVDNYLHVVIGLAWAWFVLAGRRPQV